MQSWVNAKVCELLESHKPEPLPTDPDARLSEARPAPRRRGVQGATGPPPPSPVSAGSGF